MTSLRIIMLSYERGFLDPRSEASARLEKLASEGNKITAVILSRVEKKIEDRGSVRVIGVTGSPLVRFWNVFRAAMRDAKRAKKAGESVIISAQDPFIAGKIAFMVSRLIGVPYEIQEHADFFSGAWEREFPVIHECMAGTGKFYLRRADGVRVVSERIKDRLIRVGVRADRINVIPVAQNFSSLLTREVHPMSELPTIVVPCRFVKQKGLDVLLRALASIKDQPFRVRLIGEGKEGPKLADLASQLGIRDRVEFEQWSSPDAIWKDADVFVMSSRYEGWGRTIAEAMAAGVPIVTTDVGCVGSFFRPQIDGRVVQPNDVEGLASAIREQLTEKERREQMVASARIRAKAFPEASELIEKQHAAWLRVAGDGLRVKARRAWMITAAVIIFSLLVHAIAVVMFWKTLGPNREWGFFTLVQHWFQGYGYSFASQAGCVSAYRSPGFLFFLTAVYGLFGFANFFAQAVIQNLLAVLLTYLVYRLGWRVTNDRRVGWIAALLVTLHPYTFYHYTQYYHTVISGVFLVSLLLSLLALDRTHKWRWAIWAGVMTAGLAYIQGTILPAMPFLSFWLIWRWVKTSKDVRRNAWQSILAVGVIALTSIVLIAPWTYRNWQAFHKFVPLTTDLGHALAKANNENILGLTILGFPQEVQTSDRIINPENSNLVTYRMLPEAQQALQDHGWLKPSGFFDEWHPREPGENWNTCSEIPISEPDFNAYWTTYGMSWLKVNYSTEGWKLQLLKVTQFWSPFLQPSLKYGAQWTFAKNPVLDAAARWSLASYVFFTELMTIVGFIVMKKRKQFMMLVPILIPFIVYTALHSFFAGYTKYRIPLDNLIAVVAGIAIVAIWDRLRKKKV